MSGRDAPSSKRPRHTAQRAATPESDAAVAAAPHCHAVVAAPPRATRARRGTTQAQRPRGRPLHITRSVRWATGGAPIRDPAAAENRDGANAAEETAYLDALRATAETPAVQDSVDLRLFFDELTRTLEQALATSQEGDLESAFVQLRTYMNYGLGVRGHKAYTEPAYERDRRMLGRQRVWVASTMEELKSRLVERWRAARQPAVVATVHPSQWREGPPPEDITTALVAGASSDESPPAAPHALPGGLVTRQRGPPRESAAVYDSSDSSDESLLSVYHRLTRPLETVTLATARDQRLVISAPPAPGPTHAHAQTAPPDGARGASCLAEHAMQTAECPICYKSRPTPQLIPCQTFGCANSVCTTCLSQLSLGHRKWFCPPEECCCLFYRCPFCNQPNSMTMGAFDERQLTQMLRQCKNRMIRLAD